MSGIKRKKKNSFFYPYNQILHAFSCTVVNYLKCILFFFSYFFSAACFLLLRTILGAVAFWIFDVPRFFSCSWKLYSLEVLLSVYQLCCCVLLWFAVVLVLSMCTSMVCSLNVNGVPHCVRAPLCYFKRILKKEMFSWMLRI